MALNPLFNLQKNLKVMDFWRFLDVKYLSDVPIELDFLVKHNVLLLHFVVQFIFPDSLIQWFLKSP